MAEISKVTINNTDYLLKSVSTQGIPYGDVTSDSTTVFTATVAGVTELRQGTCCLIRNNNKQTSASGWTLNVNDLGAKPVYNNMADASRETTIFNKAYTMLFVYDEDRVSGGCWICYRGYDANTNTIGYQLRTNSTVMNVSDTARYYKLYFTSADNTMWVPASVNSTNNATAARPVNQRPINPFGRIVYTSANTNYTAGSNLAATTIWDQYALSLGYSFNRTGAALTMTVEAPVYVKCAPQSDGSAIMDADTPIVQALPSTADGKIYIYLGVAYSAVNIELVAHHPVYYHDGTAIRLWTGASGSSSVAWNDITGKPTFATVATSGDYDDLSNKPTIPTVPTNVSAFTNDVGYLTSAPVTSVNGQTGAVTGLQTTSNLVTSISSSSTDTQYPSAKCVYDAIDASGTATQAKQFFGTTSSYGQTENVTVSPVDSSAFDNDVNRTGTTISVLFTNPCAGAPRSLSLWLPRYSGTDYHLQISVGRSPTSASNPLRWQQGEVLTFMVVGAYFELIARSVVLPVVTSADNGKVLTVVDGEWKAVSQETGYTVEVSLTNPAHAEHFSHCTIDTALSNDLRGDSGGVLGQIDSPSSSTTVTVPPSAYGIIVNVDGVSTSLGTTSATGGVTYITDDGYGATLFQVTGDGTATLDGIDYDD